MESFLSEYRGPVGPLRRRCPLCSFGPASGRQLLRCSGCQAFRYCSREHQTAHWPQHKSACSKTKEARAKLAQEEHDVRNHAPNYKAFEVSVGFFWDILITRNYMFARFGLIRTLLNLGTFDGVSEALDHALDMLRLGWRDDVGVQKLVPTIMLRLDLDQRCYDFMKSGVTYNPLTFDMSERTSPYLSIQGADPLEYPDFLLRDFKHLNFSTALLLLNLKLLIDVRNLKVTRKVLAQSRLPFELRDQIERDVIRSPLSVKFQKEPHERLLQTEDTLLDHIYKLGSAFDSFVWLLFDPDEELAATYTTDRYPPGSEQEMALSLQYSYPAWWETEGVLDLLNNARTCAARDAEPDFEDLRHQILGTHMELLLMDASVNRMWEYLKFVVEDASYLGPWSERPSEREFRRSDREEWLEDVKRRCGEMDEESSDEMYGQSGDELYGQSSDETDGESSDESGWTDVDSDKGLLLTGLGYS